MISIENVKLYAQELKAAVPEIKQDFLVINDTQLAKELSEVSPTNNCMLISFIPSHKLQGDNVDSVLTNDFMMFLILIKADRAEGQEEFIQTMKDAQQVAKKVWKKMLSDKSPASGTCGLMRMLQITTISADPIWALNGCDGYEISFQLKTSIYN